MGRGLTKARPGQKIRSSPIGSASQYNLIVDSVAWIQANKDKLERGINAPIPQPPRAGIVQVINEESFGFNQFDIVGLDNILFSNSDNLKEFKNNAAFRVKKPAAGTLTKFAVLQEPIANGTKRVVAAVAHGITIARLNVSDASHNFAIPTSGEWTQFSSADSGPVSVLWKETGTGSSKWAVVIINGGSATEHQVVHVIDSGSTSIANVCQAELGSVTYTETIGRRTMTFTADSPQSLIYVHEMNGPPFRNSDILFVQSINGKYYCIKTNARTRLMGYVDDPLGIVPFGSGLVRVTQNNQQPTQRTEIAYWTHMLGAAGTDPLPYGLEVIIEWFEDERRWIIVQAECETGLT